jgi:hypothetical protein
MEMRLRPQGGKRMLRPRGENSGPLPNCESCRHPEVDHFDGKLVDFNGNVICEQYVSEGYDEILCEHCGQPIKQELGPCEWWIHLDGKYGCLIDGNRHNDFTATPVDEPTEAA